MSVCEKHNCSIYMHKMTGVLHKNNNKHKSISPNIGYVDIPKNTSRYTTGSQARCTRRERHKYMELKYLMTNFKNTYNRKATKCMTEK